MKKIIHPLLLTLVLLIPCLLQARQARPHHQAHHAKKHPAPLAKAAASAKTAAVTASELLGFWADNTEDESDPEDIYRDSTEVFYGGDGKFEARLHSREIMTDTTFTFAERLIGTWKIESGNLITSFTTCSFFDSDFGEDTDCGEDPNDTESVADWSIATVNNVKTLTMADSDLGDSFLHYVSAGEGWTLQPVATAIRARQAKSAPANRATLQLQLGEVRQIPGLRALDLRGRALPGRKNGFFVVPR